MIVKKGSRVKAIGLVLGPLLFFLILTFLHPEGAETPAIRMMGVAAWMAAWWITEAVPLAATALLPVAFYPVLGILTGRETAPLYMNSIIMLFVGGFLIAIAMERWNLHKRIALTIIRFIGGGPSRLVLSFMIASAALSMWISNTATAIMMLAIGLAVVKQTESTFGVDESRPLTLGLMLGIAYGCSIGGMATLVGTPPNLVLVEVFSSTFPDAPAIGFGQWMLLGMPLSFTMLLLSWLLITRVFCRCPASLRLEREVVDDEYGKLGPVAFAEKAVMAVFVTTALLWIFRKDLALGVVSIPGWGGLVGPAGFVDDGTVAIAMALLLFLIPSRSPDEREGRRVLSIDAFGRIPWYLVLLFGGGFALAKGFQESGLAAFIGEKSAGLAGVDPLVAVAVVSASLSFLTELTSNVATTQMILPILASVSQAMQVNPLLLMVPATLSASCAFMMPVATPPNAIVFASGRIRVLDMVRVGFWLNLMGIVVVTIVFYVLGTAVLGIDVNAMPEWAGAGAGAK